MNNLYARMRNAYSYLCILIGIFVIGSMFFVYELEIGFMMTVIITNAYFVFDLETILTYMPYLGFGLYGIYCLRTKPAHVEFLPSTAFVIGTITLAMSLIDLLFDSPIVVAPIAILGISLIVASGSFYCGHIHSSTRILIVSAIYASIILFFAIRTLVREGVVPTVPNLFILAPAQMLLFISALFFIPFCIYPNDFPSTRLNRQLADVEFTMQNKPEIMITEHDLETLSGGNPDCWVKSEDPAISEVSTIEAFGGRAQYMIVAERWADEDGIRISLSSSMDKAKNWGIGAKIIYIANDNTVSSSMGRIVRIYLDNGFFLRFVVCEEKPLIRNKYQNFIVKYLNE